MRVYFIFRYTFMWAISMTSCFVYRRMLLLPFIVAKLISSAFAVYRVVFGIVPYSEFIVSQWP